jgi:tetratricopeptide (TPR) repeat protein
MTELVRPANLPHVRLEFLGPPRATLNGQLIGDLKNRELRVLAVVYLAKARKIKEDLTAELWPDADGEQADTSWKTARTRLRKAFGAGLGTSEWRPPRTDVCPVISEPGYPRLNDLTYNWSVDVADFELRVAEERIDAAYELVAGEPFASLAFNAPGGWVPALVGSVRRKAINVTLGWAGQCALVGQWGKVESAIDRLLREPDQFALEPEDISGEEDVTPFATAVELMIDALVKLGRAAEVLVRWDGWQADAREVTEDELPQALADRVKRLRSDMLAQSVRGRAGRGDRNSGPDDTSKFVETTGRAVLGEQVTNTEILGWLRDVAPPQIAGLDNSRSAVQQSRVQRLQEALRHYPLQTLSATNPIEDNMYDVSHLALETSRRKGAAEYIPRDVDEEVRDKLGKGFALLCGPAGHGKSRTAAEICLDYLHAGLAEGTRIVIPRPEVDLSRVITDLLDGPDLQSKGAVLWIDNVHEYLDHRNGSGQRLLRPKEVADWIGGGGRIMATIWDSRYRDFEANMAGRESGSWEVVRQGHLVRLEGGPPSPHELGLAEGLYDLDLSRGIGETFKVVEQLVTRLYTSISESPDAYALVRIGIDWYRCGMGRVVPEHVLRDLLSEYRTDAGITARPDSFEGGIDWARVKVLRTTSLLELEGDGYSVADVILYRVTATPNDLPRLSRAVRKDTWGYVLTHANERELLDIGAAAYLSGQLDVALAAYHHAATLYAPMVHSGRDELRSDLALAVMNLGITRYSLGLYDEAIGAYDEAIETYRQLVYLGQDELCGDLAQSIMNRGCALAELGRNNEAIGAYDEAIETYRQLVYWGQDCLRSALAGAIMNRGSALARLGRYNEAIGAYDEAIETYRQLVNLGQDELCGDLGQSIMNRGRALAELGRNNEAIGAYDEAIEIFRQLVNLGQDELCSHLVRTFVNRSCALAKLGRNNEAISAYDEAIETYRQLVYLGQDELRSELAGAVMNRGSALAELGRNNEAIGAYDEAIEIFRQLVNLEQDELCSDLAGAIMNRGSALAELGRNNEAIGAYDEAIEIFRQLVNLGQDELRTRMERTLQLRGMLVKGSG